MPEPKNPIGPAGQQVAANVALIRKARGMTKQALSEATAKVGRPIPPLGISRIEAFGRRVDVDDLAALAAVFEVEPAVLLAPITIRTQIAIEIEEPRDV